MFSPPDWCLGMLSGLRTEAFESSSEEIIVSVPEMPQAPTTHIAKCMILGAIENTFMLKPLITVVAKKKETLPELHFFLTPYP